MSNTYDFRLVGLLFAIAALGVYISTLARQVTLARGRTRQVWFIGMGYWSMYFVIMLAATPPQVNALTLTPQATDMSPIWWGVAIGIAVLVIFSLTLIGLSVAQQMSAQRQRLEQQEAEARRAQLFTTTTLRIRESLNVEQILLTVVQEVRTALATDRLVIYRFDSNWKGTVVAESVDPAWSQTLYLEIDDPCFRERQVKQYEQGRVSAINNIYRSGLADCHIKMLEQFEVKSNLVVCQD